MVSIRYTVCYSVDLSVTRYVFITLFMRVTDKLSILQCAPVLSVYYSVSLHVMLSFTWCVCALLFYTVCLCVAVHLLHTVASTKVPPQD